MDVDKNKQVALKIFDFMAGEPEFDGFSFYESFRRYVCIYSDWRERIKGGGAN